MALKHKKTAIALISVVILIGFFTVWVVAIGMSFLSHLDIYIDDCHSISKPYLVNLILAEIALTTFFLTFYIYIEFQMYRDLQKKRIQIALIALSANFLIAIGHVIIYPLLVRVSGVWLDRITESSVFTNPLLYVSLLTGGLIIWMNYRFKDVFNTKLFARIINLIVIVLLITALLVTLSIKVNFCQG